MDADDRARNHELCELMEEARLRVERSDAAVRESQQLLAQWRESLHAYRARKARFQALLDHWRTLGE
jgi:hypothetical protein